MHTEYGDFPVDLDLGTIGAFSIDGIDFQIYIATFWYNVQEFWESEAYAMSVLTTFSGLVQPIMQV